MRLEKWPLIQRPIQLDKSTNGRGQRKVRSFWSNGFSASIIIPDRTLRPGRKIQGKVVIHSKSLVTFTGLRVQLDAQCTLFLEKNGELVNKRFSILQTEMNNCAQNNNANNQNKRSSNGSPIQCDAVESLANSKEIYALIPDINSVVDATIFPFSLEIPGEKAFPCPFNNTVGTLVYKLSAHLCSQDLRYAQIAEETLDFKGYFNLSQNIEETGKAIVIPRPLAQKPDEHPNDISATFRVESSGFLSEEAVHFVLTVKNPRKKTMHMKVLITQKVTYSIAENCWKKVTSTVVRCERAEVSHSGSSGSECGEVVWRGALIIPKGQVPSFTSANNHSGYSVSYTLQFKVEGIDQDWSLKGTAPLYIGTCRNMYCGRLITG